MGNADLIFIIFRIINSLLIGSIIIYFLRHSLLPFVYEADAAEKHHIDQLKKSRDEKKDAIQMSATAIANQREMCQALRAKVERWQHACKERESQRLKHMNQIKQELAHKTTTQEYFFEKNLAARTIVPLVVETVRKDLTYIMSSPCKKENYLANILNALGKGTYDHL